MSQIHDMPDRIRLGCMGWNYDAWVGPFVPPGTRAVDFLSVYARAFDTVEVDSTSTQCRRRDSRGWADRVPRTSCSRSSCAGDPQEALPNARCAGSVSDSDAIGTQLDRS